MSQSVKRAARILGSIVAEPKPVAALAVEFGIHRLTMFRELQAPGGGRVRAAPRRWPFAPGLQLAALGGRQRERRLGFGGSARVSAATASRCPIGSGSPTVVSTAVCFSDSALISAASRMM